MSAYGKLFLRIVILLVLVAAIIAVAKPAPVAASLQDCCQTCENRYEACIANCTTQLCRSTCELELSRCIEICPACE